MKVVVAVDSFKGSMTSMEAGMAVKAGILAAKKDAEVIVKPLADGGEGTTDALIEGLMATVLFFVGRFFIKSRNTERSVLFLSGDYTGLNTEKICRVTGKRIKTWAMLFCLGGIIDFIKLGAGIIIVSVFFIILLVFHLVDMTINRDKYRV